MDKKSPPSNAADETGDPPLTGAVKDSAQQIWLAGLGAFAKAQEEGGKMFEALVKEGLAIQRKTQAAAEEKITEVTSRMADMASDLTSRATGKWDKLENIFEDRVARALKTLGVPSARDIELLSARIDEMERSAAKHSAAPKAGAAKHVAKKAPAAKRTPARKSSAE
ncbi:phasin family protein [Ramlibacter sp. 2FC]|uniref:phasin family protein n=1 Tax=Ramlibacter sp. 2FC TaxID=2502188 RepID=UPI0010F836B0|nr:phasin family protein [Ramlibacter sp. 2FC]